MRLVLLLFTAGRASADGFHAGDAWRGTMTNCQQSPHMLRRAVRYIAIELSVLAVDDRRTCIRQRAGGARSVKKLADHRRRFEPVCGRSTPSSRSITAYRRAPRRRPRTRGPTPSPCWACAVSCSGLSSIRSRRRCDCRRGAPTPSRSSSRRRGSPGSQAAVVFRFSCGAYLREGKDSGSRLGRRVLDS